MRNEDTTNFGRSHMCNFNAKIRLAAAAGLFLAACGRGVTGTYTGEDGFFDKLTFKSGGKVEITFMTMTREATYVVESDRIRITNSGDTQTFTIDEQGCLDGGGLLGRYCKGKVVGQSATLVRR